MFLNERFKRGLPEVGSLGSTNFEKFVSHWILQFFSDEKQIGHNRKKGVNIDLFTQMVCQVFAQTR